MMTRKILLRIRYRILFQTLFVFFLGLASALILGLMLVSPAKAQSTIETAITYSTLERMLRGSLASDGASSESGCGQSLMSGTIPDDCHLIGCRYCGCLWVAGNGHLSWHKPKGITELGCNTPAGGGFGIPWYRSCTPDSPEPVSNPTIQ